MFEYVTGTNGNGAALVTSCWGEESPQEILPSLTISFREVKYYWDLQEAPVAEQPQL